MGTKWVLKYCQDQENIWGWCKSVYISLLVQHIILTNPTYVIQPTNEKRKEDYQWLNSASPSTNNDTYDRDATYEDKVIPTTNHLLWMIICLHIMLYWNTSSIFNEALVLLTDFYSISFLQHKHQHIIHPSISIYPSTMQQTSSHVKKWRQQRIDDWKVWFSHVSGLWRWSNIFSLNLIG